MASSKRKDYISWDEYFMGVASLAALRSKDPNTQVGACIVSDDNKILSMGYNGLPVGCSDDEFPWNRESDDPYDNKYLFPCNECAKAIIQCGIKKVIYGDDKYGDTSSVKASKRMMAAAGVEYIPYEKSGKEIKIKL